MKQLILQEFFFPGCEIIMTCSVIRLPVTGGGPTYQMSQTIGYTADRLSGGSWSSAVVSIYDLVLSENLLYSNTLSRRRSNIAALSQRVDDVTFPIFPDGVSITDLKQYSLLAMSFEIPQGSNWYVSSVRFGSSSEVSEGETAAVVWIFEDDNGLPGTMVYSGKTIYFSCILDSDLGCSLCSVPLASNPLLSSGSYWVSVALEAAFIETSGLKIISDGNGDSAVYCGSNSTDTQFDCSDSGVWLSSSQNFAFQVYGSSDSDRISSFIYFFFKLFF